MEIKEINKFMGNQGTQNFLNFYVNPGFLILCLKGSQVIEISQ